jgi:TonB family protein
MRTILAGCLLVWLSGSSFGQEEKPLCPRHIETPGYPQIARVAHVEGILTLAVTIDADGNVADAEVANDDKRAGVALLKRFAIFNVRTWIFTKPPSVPYKVTIVYDYEIDKSLPLDDPKVNVKFDLPDHVMIVASDVSTQTDHSTKKN